MVSLNIHKSNCTTAGNLILRYFIHSPVMLDVPPPVNFFHIFSLSLCMGLPVFSYEKIFVTKGK
jgi:hypothetical protein